MKQFLITVAGVLVGLFLFVIVGPILLVGALSGASRPATPSATVLSVDLRKEIADQRSSNPFSSFAGRLNTIDIVRKLEAAAKDDHVKGLYIRANTTGVAPAQAEEIRDAIARFRANKKFVIAHIQSDSIPMSLGGYFTIAGADEVWLQETGDLQPMGMVFETMFLGGAFEKFRITPQFEQREEYKNAVNTYTQKGFTPAHREATQDLVENIYKTAIAYIAADRKMTPDQADKAIKGTPYAGPDAVKVKLVDKLGRPEDAEKAALDKAGADAELTDLEDYEAPKPKGPAIALITGEGAIMSGPDEGSPFADEKVMNSDDISEAFADAADDKSVKAIVFRVNSPGGSAVASDQIAHAVELAKAKGKKVIVSMGPYAASGGYYVSAPADAIVADPLTITGSIGIFGGKFVLGDAINYYTGANFDAITAGSPTINLVSPDRPFTNAEREAFKAMIDRGYADFLNTVARGRKMPFEKVHDVAHGRVWTGAQAKERGLVDELGGLSTAIAKAKQLANVGEKESVTLKLFPKQKSPVEELRDMFGASAEGARAAVVLGAILGDERVNRVLSATMTERNEPLSARAPDMRVR